MTVSPHHIWKKVTGGGLPVAYLRWLAAMWEQYKAEAADMDFNEWLVGKFNNEPL